MLQPALRSLTKQGVATTTPAASASALFRTALRISDTAPVKRGSSWKAGVDKKNKGNVQLLLPAKNEKGSGTLRTDERWRCGGTYLVHSQRQK